VLARTASAQQGVGDFTGHGDVGTVTRPAPRRTTPRRVSTSCPDRERTSGRRATRSTTRGAR
jgi:hypothetical protein